MRSTAEIGGEIRRDGGAVRGNARRLGEHGHIGVDQLQTGRTHARGHLAQEHPAVRAAVARVAVGEMHADIALPQRTQHGIAQRVDHHVAIGMRKHSAVVGNAYAAEHDVLSVAKTCTSKP